MNANSIKCVATGDGFVGKTTLLMRLCDKEFNENYVPTIFDNHSINFVHNGQTYEIIFFDTAGQEEYNMLRKQVYESASVFFVCFDVSNTDSFSNVKEIWLPELEEYSTSSKILIGTKSDLRNDLETIDKLNANDRIFVNQSGAQNFAKTHKMTYIECSAKTQDNIQEVLKTVIELYRGEGTSGQVISSGTCCCVNPVLQLVKRALCCKNTYL